MIEVPTSTSALHPEGSSFLVASCTFCPSTAGIGKLVLDLPEDRLADWPMVYILANEVSAYVGQTTSVTSRMAQHWANAEKRQFNTATVIYNEEFNASVITDYEHRLIELMHADGCYQLTNKNDGMTPTNYFSKDEYTQMFDELWEELRRLELAEHTIDELEESEVFKYSPYKGLNTQQRVALDTIMQAIEGGLDAAGPIVVEGKPGTGKTVLAVYLLKMLRDDERHAGLNIKILEHVRALLDGAPSQPREFDGYDFVLHESFEEFVASFEQTYERHSLSRVIAGYAWPWATKQRKGAAPAAEFDIVIDGIGLRWNCTYDNWVVKGANDPAIAHEVGCIHSIQGYDLSYAYVIVGDDLRLNPGTGLLEANKDSYFDRNGSATATPEELTGYIKNIYYVLLTRGILGTYVYVHDPALREYFARYFR